MYVYIHVYVHVYIIYRIAVLIWRFGKNLTNIKRVTLSHNAHTFVSPNLKLANYVLVSDLPKLMLAKFSHYMVLRVSHLQCILLQGNLHVYTYIYT